MANRASKEISSREDVAVLVTTFYSRIREHEILGPFFNQTIKDWPAHLEQLTTFWESQLFLNRSYTGDPINAHCRVDRAFDHSITPEHFGQWIQVWITVIDEHFTGERAWIAKNRARKMSTMFYLKIYEARDKL